MRAYVVDTSVAAAWYLPEAHASAARDWQQQMLDGKIELVVPSLHYVEMANLLRKLIRRGHVAEALARQIDALHQAAPLQVVDPPRDSVLSTSLQYDATAYDAVFIALANTLQAPLVTAERGTTPWVAKLGSRAITMEP